MPKDEHPAVSALRAFFTAMRDWELAATAYFRRVESGDVTGEGEVRAFKAAHRAKLVAIFERCVDAGADAVRLQDEGFSFGAAEPIYDPAFEEIVTVSTDDPERVTIETRQLCDMRLRLRYEVSRDADEWKVSDNRKGRFENQTKWKRTPL
jgi:hypothetical protein